MAQTSQETVQNLVDRAVKLSDRQLAADIRAFAAQRQFGLVFEHNRPERMRLHGKKITRGDIVQVLPTRGEREKPYNKLLLARRIHLRRHRRPRRPQNSFIL